MQASTLLGLSLPIAPSRPQAARKRQTHRLAPAAAAAKQRTKQQTGGKGFGKAPSSPRAPAPEFEIQAEETEQQPAPAALQQAPAEASGSTPAAASDSGALPSVSKGRIFAVCAQVTALVTVLGFGLRQVAPAISPAVAGGQADRVEELLQWATLPSLSQLGLAVAVAAAVTGARAVLLSVWPEFREASDKSNQQVLTPLDPADLLWVASLPGISEELLFRGALVPAIYPDWRGIVIAGLAFGVLHNNGGRNPAFAAWASLVGCVYGALFLSTGAVICPALAHSLANVASAALWKAANGGSSDASSSGGTGSGTTA